VLPGCPAGRPGEARAWSKATMPGPAPARAGRRPAFAGGRPLKPGPVQGEAVAPHRYHTSFTGHAQSVGALARWGSRGRRAVAGLRCGRPVHGRSAGERRWPPHPRSLGHLRGRGSHDHRDVFFQGGQGRAAVPAAPEQPPAPAL